MTRKKMLSDCVKSIDVWKQMHGQFNVEWPFKAIQRIQTGLQTMLTYEVSPDTFKLVTAPIHNDFVCLFPLLSPKIT